MQEYGGIIHHVNDGHACQYHQEGCQTCEVNDLCPHPCQDQSGRELVLGAAITEHVHFMSHLHVPLNHQASVDAILRCQRIRDG